MCAALFGLMLVCSTITLPCPSFLPAFWPSLRSSVLSASLRCLFSVSPLATLLRSDTCPKRLPIKVRIQIPAPRHFDFGNPFDLAQAVGNLLCNLPRRPLHPLRQFKTYRRRCLTHLNLRRPFQHNRQLHPIL